MIIHRFNRPLESRVLFVWDGTDRFNTSADRFVRLLQGQRVYAVHAMPHESIHSYGSVNCETKPKSPAAASIEDKFRNQVSRLKTLRRSSFELLFGDRINEIVVTAAQLQAKMILMPRFEQMAFSKWIHGDLNAKIRARATCPVIFLDANLGEKQKRRWGEIDVVVHRESS